MVFMSVPRRNGTHLPHTANGKAFKLLCSSAHKILAVSHTERLEPNWQVSSDFALITFDPFEPWLLASRLSYPAKRSTKLYCRFYTILPDFFGSCRLVFRCALTSIKA